VLLSRPAQAGDSVAKRRGAAAPQGAAAGHNHAPAGRDEEMSRLHPGVVAKLKALRGLGESYSDVIPMLAKGGGGGMSVRDRASSRHWAA
jgi:hypothetical protein